MISRMAKPFWSILVIFRCICPSVLANDEVDALIAVKNNLVYLNGVLQTWIATDATPCSWSHVACNNLSSVTKIFLGDAALSGPLAPEIGLLKSLEYLELYDNGITGSIPSEAGNLSNLQYLRLKNNSLSGPIPVSLTALSSLKVLDLSNNDLSGEVPSNGSFLHFTPLSFANNPSLCGKMVNISCTGALPPDFSPPSPWRSKSVPISPPPPPPSPPYLPLPPPPPPPSAIPESSSPSNAVIIGIALAIGLVLLGIGSFGFWWFFRNQRQTRDISEIQLAQVRFSLRELQVATDDFSNNNILGRGGSGKVYKGNLMNGSLVAVKRLNRDCILSNLQDFKNEIEIFNKLEHRSLLPLVGFCATPIERLLVYPFMANGSVHSCLQAHTPLLDWETRKKIALDSAKALDYLHHHCTRKILHCDIKAANIMLDDQLRAFIGDFGLATVMPHGDDQVVSSVRGTLGHIAPEYISFGILSDKVDVYAYGITLLELVTGQGPYTLARDKDMMLFHWVSSLVERKQLEELVDPDLRENYKDIETDVESVVQLAMLCTQQSPQNRPTMSDVVRMLENQEGIAKLWLDRQHDGSGEEEHIREATRYLLDGLNTQSDTDTSRTSTIGLSTSMTSSTIWFSVTDGFRPK